MRRHHPTSHPVGAHAIFKLSPCRGRDRCNWSEHAIFIVEMTCGLKYRNRGGFLKRFEVTRDVGKGPRYMLKYCYENREFLNKNKTRYRASSSSAQF
jgi:hypothetical protein